ncbi:MAG: hypothetical protein ACYCO9_21045 [Streptosporangiaceae bacterium]
MTGSPRSAGRAAAVIPGIHLPGTMMSFAALTAQEQAIQAQLQILAQTRRAQRRQSRGRHLLLLRH